jgi:hypothetical protein
VLTAGTFAGPLRFGINPTSRQSLRRWPVRCRIEDVSISTGNLSDGLIAFKDGRMISLRVPYPLGFYAKGLDGRIDDPAAGWKGRGLWTTSGDRTPWLKEGGKGTKPMVVHVQLRPDPLAD